MQNIAAANTPTGKILCRILWISSLNVAMLHSLFRWHRFFSKDDLFAAEQ
jgi:hypothetical protein